MFKICLSTKHWLGRLKFKNLVWSCNINLFFLIFTSPRTVGFSMMVPQQPRNEMAMTMEAAAIKM